MAKLKSGIAAESLGNYVKALKTACGESASISVELVDEEIYYTFTAFDSCGEKFEAWTVWSWEYAKTGELQVRLNETLSRMDWHLNGE